MPSEATELSTATNAPTTAARSSIAQAAAIAGTENYVESPASCFVVSATTWTTDNYL